MLIIGAGLAGLIAAHAWPQATVVEAQEKPEQRHKALLRFRSDAVAKLTGVEFRSVTVRKGVWDTDAQKYVAPDIAAANQYTQKCGLGIAPDRSIWRLDPAERYVAPDDFYPLLVDSVGSRIQWATPFSRLGLSVRDPRELIVSTAPLEWLASQLSLRTDQALLFRRAPITVTRFHVKDCDTFQTAYFPRPATSVYRASITGSTLIVESTAPIGHTELIDVCVAFALGSAELKSLGASEQRYGKIAPIPDSARKAMMFQLTHEYGVYSLGRFATWRNILLDDVVDDISVIKRMIRNANHYDTRRVLLG